MDEKQQFLIRLPNGEYFLEMVERRVITTPLPRLAEHFPSRWAALQQASAGNLFANAYIVPYEPPGAPASGFKEDLE